MIQHISALQSQVAKLQIEKENLAQKLSQQVSINFLDYDSKTEWVTQRMNSLQSAKEKLLEKVNLLKVELREKESKIITLKKDQKEFAAMLKKKLLKEREIHVKKLGKEKDTQTKKLTQERAAQIKDVT